MPKRIARPKEIRIMGSLYRISFLKNLKEDCGETRLDLKRIYINPTMTMDVQKETLLHEILHCCLIDLFCQSGMDSKNLEIIEETIVLHLSPRLFQVLRDNPKVLNWLIAGV